MNNKIKISRINIIRNTLLVCFVLYSMMAAHTQPILSQQVSGNAVPGGVVTLTFTIDNSVGAAAVTNINLTGQLSAGLTIATPSNPSTTCTSGTLTAMAGTGSITYIGGSVGAGATCTISVDVTSSSEGMFLSTASLSSSAGNSGSDFNTLTFAAPELDITLDDSISFDPSMDMIANPNDSIQYTLKIENTGDVSVHNLEINRGSDPNTSLDPSTIKATPVAINDIYQLSGSPFNVPMVMGVLTNDADVNDPLPNPPYNANLTVLSVQGGAVGSPQTTENGGTITVQSDGSFVYDSTGVATAIADSFYYNIIDTEGFQDSARVIVFWTRPPEAQNDDLDDWFSAIVNIGNIYLTGTLFNDNGNGPDDLGIPAGSLVSFGGGDAPGVVTTNAAGSTVAFAGGTLTVNGDGSLTLSNPNMSGNFTFQYKVENTIGSSVATVNLMIIESPVAQRDTATFLFYVDQNISAGAGLFVDNGSGADNLGYPTATLTVFGGGSLGGSVTDNAAGASVSLAGGTLTVNDDGSWSLTGQPFTKDTFSFDYRLESSSGTSDATVTLIILDDPPVAQPDAYTATGNISINTTNIPGNDLLQNDTGFGITVTSVQGSTLNVGMTATTTNGGSVVVQTNGEFSYTPPTGYTGIDDFSYSVGNGSGNSAPVTVSITIADLIYFMDDAAAVGGDGSLDKPYKTIAEHNGTPPAANSYLFIKDNGAAYSGNLTLVSGQTVIGEGSTGALFGVGSLTEISLAPLSNTVSYNTTGMNNEWAQLVNPSGSVVTLNTGNKISGLSVGNRMTYAFTDNGASTGALSLKESEVTGTGGGVKIENGGTLDIALASLTASGGAYGLWLKGTSGMMIVSGGAITNSATSAITVDGGSVISTFSSSSISQSVNANTVHVLGGHSGIITYSGTVNTTNGNGFQFDNADGQYNFNSAVTLNGGDAGIDIVNGSGGSFTFSNTTITNPTGTAFNVNSSSANISYLGGTITQNSSASGVVVNTNTSITRIGAELNLNTGSNPAINVTGGGSILITNANNVVTTTSATAVTIDGTNIGASGVTLESVSSNGATRGIYLNNAGPSLGGFFTVTGTGSTDGTGGTIQNIINRGAEIINTDKVTLKNMNFTNVGIVDGAGLCNELDNIGCHAGIYGLASDDIVLDNLLLSGGVQIGINGNDINNWSLSNSTVQGFGDEVNEHGIYMRELTGTTAIDNSTIKTSAERNVLIETSSGTLNFVSNGSTYSESSMALGADGLELGINGSTTATIEIANCNFLTNRTNGLQVHVEGSAIVTQCDVTNSTFDPMGGPGIGLDLATANTGQLKFNVIGNPKIYSNGGPAVNIFSDDNSHIEGRINDNSDIRVGGIMTSGTGIRVNVNNESRGIVQIHNNTVGNIGNDIGIDAVARLRSVGGACGGGCMNGRLDATITNNMVAVVDPGTSLYDIRTQAQEENTVCANVSNNNASNLGIAAYRARTNDADASLYLQGFSTNATMTWASNTNTPTVVGAVSESGVGTLGGGTCTLPSNPLP